MLFPYYRHSDLADRLGHSPNYKKMLSNQNATSPAMNKKPQLNLDNYENIEHIQIEKGPKGLGFAIMDGSHNADEGIYIKTLIPGGPASNVS